MPQFALSAIGRDRPGIVAEVTRALLGHSLNITDSQMAVLSGHFTMMLVVTAPEGTDVDSVQEELARTRDRLRSTRCRSARSARRTPPPARAVPHRHRLRRRPPGDRARGVARLAARAVNVTDLETRLVGEGGQAGLYAMVLEVALPAGMDAGGAAGDARRGGRRAGRRRDVRPLEPDVM